MHTGCKGRLAWQGDSCRQRGVAACGCVVNTVAGYCLCVLQVAFDRLMPACRQLMPLCVQTCCAKAQANRTCIKAVLQCMHVCVLSFSFELGSVTSGKEGVEMSDKGAVGDVCATKSEAMCDQSGFCVWGVCMSVSVSICLKRELVSRIYCPADSK